MTSCKPNDKISLLQAALWVVRGHDPDPESLFRKAPITLSAEEQSPVGPLRRLFYALAEEQLKSTAKVAVIYPDDKHDELVPVDAGPFEVPAYAWQFEAVRWNDSSLEILDSWDFPPGVQSKLDLSGDWFAFGGRAFWQPILLTSGDVSKVFSPNTNQLAAPHVELPRNAGGRPDKFDWPGFYAAAAALIHNQGLPKTQSEFCDAMADWCHREWGDNVPGDTTLKKRAGEFFKGVKRQVGN